MRWPLAAVLLAMAPACTLFESDPEGEDRERVALEGLDVVEPDDPFDPSQVLEDSDEDEGEATAREASGEREGRAREADAEADELDAEAAVPKAQAPREAVPSEEQVRRREQDLEQGIEAAGEAEDDEAVKRELASNPEAADPGPAEPAGNTALDLALELVLLIVLALPVTLLVLSLRRHPVATTLVVALLALSGWMFLLR